MSQNQSWSREVAVITPEQVRLTFQTAGLGSRAGAHTIDIIILGLFFLLLAVLSGEFLIRANGTFLGGLSSYVIAVLLAVIALTQLAYFVVCEVTMGRTIGGRIVGLRVVMEDGRPITVLSSLIRNFLRLIDMLPMFYVLGALMIFFHPRDKRLGDLLAGTVVIYDGKRKGRQIEEEKRSKVFASYRDAAGMAFVLEEGVKRRISREDWVLLVSYIERFDTLSDEKQLTLANGLFRLLSERLGLSEEFIQEYRHRPIPFLLTLYEQLREDYEL